MSERKDVARRAPGSNIWHFYTWSNSPSKYLFQIYQIEIIFLIFSRKGEWEQGELNKHPPVSINHAGWETQVYTGCVDTGWENAICHNY